MTFRNNNCTRDYMKLYTITKSNRTRTEMSNINKFTQVYMYNYIQNKFNQYTYLSMSTVHRHDVITSNFFVHNHINIKINNTIIFAWYKIHTKYKCMELFKLQLE